MRAKAVSQGVKVNAIAGTHVVVLGFDLSQAKRKGCLGFAIQREDHTEGERYWMSGMKTFRDTDPGLGPGGQVSSRNHPFQSFQWADYSAKPEDDYSYSVIPLYGTPTALKEGPLCAVRIQTEPELGDPHSVFFNRGRRGLPGVRTTVSGQAARSADRRQAGGWSTRSRKTPPSSPDRPTSRRTAPS